MPKNTWDHYSMPAPRAFGMESKYRVQTTGPAKAKVEHWQRNELKPLSLDGLSAADAIEAITKAAAGLEEAYVVNEVEYDSYGDGAWVSASVSGWVSGVSDEEIAAIKKHIAEQYERSLEFAARQRAQAEAQLEHIRRTFPELMNEVKPGN